MNGRLRWLASRSLGQPAGAPVKVADQLQPTFFAPAAKSQAAGDTLRNLSYLEDLWEVLARLSTEPVNVPRFAHPSLTSSCFHPSRRLY